MAPSGRAQAMTWGVLLHRTLHIVPIVWILVQGGSFLGALVQCSPSVRPLAAVLVASQLVLVGLCIRGVRRPLGPMLIACGLLSGAAGVLAGAVLGSLDHGLDRAAAIAIPVQAGMASGVFMVATTKRFFGQMLAVTVLGGIYLAANGSAGLDADVAELWIGPMIGTATFASLAVYLRSGSVYAEQLARSNRLAAAELARSQAHADAVGVARRLIHDDVISALRGVVAGVPRDQIVSASEAALTAIGQHGECGGRADLLAMVSADSPLGIRLVDDGWPIEPPGRVLSAMRLAALEALRNVERHSGVDAAVVRASFDGEACELSVADRGVGISRKPGFGITQSIVARMAQVGGTSVVESDRGGTTVRLRWALPEAPIVERRIPYASQNRWHGYLPVAISQATGACLWAWLHPGPHPYQAFALAVTLFLMVLVSAWWFAFLPSRPWDLVPAVAVTCGFLVWGLSIAGDGALLDYQGWVIGFASTILIVYAFEARVLHVVIFVSIEVAVIAFFAWRDPIVGVLDPIGALSSPVVNGVVSCACGSLLRRGTQLMRRDEAVAAAYQADHAWLEAQDLARRSHLAFVRSEVSPFLRAAAAGQVVDTSRAAVLAARCREELSLPWALPDQVRAAVDQARESGTQVSFRSADGATQWPAGLDEVLVEVLRVGRVEVVTVFPGASSKIVVLPALAGRRGRELERSLAGLATLSGDGVRTVIHPSQTAVEASAELVATPDR